MKPSAGSRAEENLMQSPFAATRFGIKIVICVDQGQIMTPLQTWAKINDSFYI